MRWAVAPPETGLCFVPFRCDLPPASGRGPSALRRGVGTLTFLGAAGVGWNFWRSTSARPFALSVRVDYLVELLSATGFAKTHSRPPVSGVDALVQAGLQLTTDVDALVGFGLEDAFAKTYIDLQGARVATLPSWGPVAEAGVRLRF